jgi:hypothetical protein
LNRENFSADPADYPFPVSLEPLSSDALAKYVIAESPTIDKVATADRNEVQSIAQQADKAVSGTASKVNHVGIIYASLYWLMQKGDAAEGLWLFDQDVIDCLMRLLGAGFHLADDDFADAVNVNRFAALASEWGIGDPSMHVDSGTPRSNALAAIAWIAAQGEGPNDSIPQSHFQVFLGLYRRLKNLPANAALDVPVNPSTAPPTRGQPSANLITEPVTLLWAQILNLRYQILLLDVTVGLRIDRTVEGPLRTNILANWAVQNEMANFLFTLAPALTSKKRTTGGATSPVFAGAPFELDEIPSSVCEQWKKQKDLIAKCASVVANLKNALKPDDPDQAFLDSIVSFDQSRQTIVDQKIAQLCHP